VQSVTANSEFTLSASVDLGSGLVKGLDTTSAKSRVLSPNQQRQSTEAKIRTIKYSDIISITVIAGQEASVSRLFSRAKQLVIAQLVSSSSARDLLQTQQDRFALLIYGFGTRFIWLDLDFN